MGVTIREKVKGSGVYWIFINHQGKRKSKKIGSKTAANRVKKEIERKLALGHLEIKKKKSSTFKEYSDIWETITLPSICKPSTISDYKALLRNHILPELKNVELSQINRMTVKNFLMQKYNSGLSQSTVSHIKSVISGVLSLAVDDEQIPSNPALKLGKIFIEKKINDVADPLNRNELSILLDTFVKKFPKHYPLALLLARTGMRFGEALALQWGDIDFNGRFITIKRNFVRNKVQTPKNGKSRHVDMSIQLTQTLSNLKHARKIETVKRGWPEVPEWLFINTVGKPIHADNWRKRIFGKALEQSGLRKIRIHDLRHTYASLLIQAGESLAYIKDQLGHHSISITVDTYGHLVPGGNKSAVDRLDDEKIFAPIRTLSAPQPKKAYDI